MICIDFKFHGIILFLIETSTITYRIEAPVLVLHIRFLIIIDPSNDLIYRKVSFWFIRREKSATFVAASLVIPPIIIGSKLQLQDVYSSFSVRSVYYKHFSALARYVTTKILHLIRYTLYYTYIKGIYPRTCLGWSIT